MKATRIGFTVYGGSGALKFEPTVTEAGDPTLLIEAANGEPNKYQWDDKIIFQVTTRELPALLASIFGWTPTFTAANHGSGNKSLMLENQSASGRIFCRVSEGGKRVAVPIGPADAFSIGRLGLSQLALYSKCPVHDALEILRLTTGRLLHNQAKATPPI
ncbi:hypothetical protein BLL42_26970 (plasmid) [Pseudomonas frederiksbergensis]|uniref:Uncharacterized protein n=1 Tax=Pseudomonas frederiksbergensis TaxID=104087 RepID=A0A1J0ET97_9PSED|nr:hypothetical protein [Pseudomonas frederiksbergensis]APC19386.1 hypothetical protein BLL42_26970 [Pseudomonas frederiksbergensis]